MEARAREMQWLRRIKWLYFSTSFFWDIVPLVVTVISFMGFVLISKGELTVAIAFPALSGFSLLTQALTMVCITFNHGPSDNEAVLTLISVYRSQ